MNCISFVLCGFAFLESFVEKHLLPYCQILSLPHHLYFHATERSQVGKQEGMCLGKFTLGKLKVQKLGNFKLS